MVKRRRTGRRRTQRGSRNCQAETPAERTTTSSYLRLSVISMVIAAMSAMNGTTCCITMGTRMADTMSTPDAVKPGTSLARDESSVKLMMSTSVEIATNSPTVIER